VERELPWSELAALIGLDDLAELDLGQSLRLVLLELDGVEQVGRGGLFSHSPLAILRLRNLRFGFGGGGAGGESSMVGAATGSGAAATSGFEVFSGLGVAVTTYRAMFPSFK
jgi:hypothetical protein